MTLATEHRSEYQTYCNARLRCVNENHPDFHNYGGRGIKFLLKSFEEFFAEVGPRPMGHLIDRRNNDGHYEVGNLRWVTPKESAANSRVVLNAKTYGMGERNSKRISDIQELVRREGISRQAAWFRLRKATGRPIGRPRKIVVDSALSLLDTLIP